MDKTQYIFNTLFLVPFQTLRIGWAINIRQNCGCGGNPRRAKTFKFLILIFIFVPFFLKSLPSSASEMMNKFGHSFIMLRELSQNEKIQSSSLSFKLVDSIVERIGKCFVVSEVFASSGMPESETVRGDNSSQSDGGGNKSDSNFSIYISLLVMFLPFIFRIRGHNIYFYTQHHFC